MQKVKDTRLPELWGRGEAGVIQTMPKSYIFGRYSICHFMDLGVHKYIRFGVDHDMHFHVNLIPYFPK